MRICRRGSAFQLHKYQAGLIIKSQHISYCCPQQVIDLWNAISSWRRDETCLIERQVIKLLAPCLQDWPVCCMTLCYRALSHHKFLVTVKTQISSLSPQKPVATGPYTEPIQSSSKIFTTYFSKIHFNIIFPPMLIFLRLSSLEVFVPTSSVNFLFFHVIILPKSPSLIWCPRQ